MHKNINWLFLLKFSVIFITITVVSSWTFNILYIFGFIQWDWLDLATPEIRKIWPIGSYLLLIGYVNCLILLLIKRQSIAWGLFIAIGVPGLLILSILSLTLRKKLEVFPNTKKSWIKLLSLICLYFIVIGMLILPFINIQSVKRLWQRTFLNISNNTQLVDNIDKELDLTKSEYALIIESQAIDEYPLWSDDGKFVYAMIEGYWMKLNIDKVRLGSGTWRGGIPIGINDNLLSLESAKESQEIIDLLISKNKYDEQYLTLLNGTKLGFEQPGFYSQFIRIKPGQEPETLWETDGELCYYLIPSPDQKYVLFKCELNGIVLMKI